VLLTFVAKKKLFMGFRYMKRNAATRRNFYGTRVPNAMNSLKTSYHKNGKVDEEKIKA